MTNIMPKGNRSNPARVPKTAKENFWSRERVKRNWTIKEVAEALGVRSETYVGMWFTGQLMPNDVRVREICDLFGVDFNEGQLAFQKAHLEWKADHDIKYQYSGINKNSPKKEEKIKSASPKPNINNIAEAILAIYGKISCEAFLNVYNTITEGKPGDCDIERILYSKVDFDTYQQIVAIMKS